MTARHYNQMIDLTQEEPTGIFVIDPVDEFVDCVCCEGEGCEVCNFTGLEYPEES